MPNYASLKEYRLGRVRIVLATMLLAPMRRRSYSPRSTCLQNPLSHTRRSTRAAV